MSYTARTRDRYRLAVAAVTGVTSIAALTATGWFTGLASASYQETLSDKAQAGDAATAANEQAQAEYEQAQAEYETQLAEYEAAQKASLRPQALRPPAQPIALKQRPTLQYVPTEGDVVPAPNSVPPARTPEPGEESTPPPSETTPEPAPAPKADPTPEPEPDPTPEPPPPPPPPPPPSTGS